MILQTHPESQPLKAHDALPGCWSLMPGTALSLLPREAGVLHIASGRVWATVDGPHTGHANESGDYFLQAGQMLAVHGGQHLVLERWDAVPESPVNFDWAFSAVDKGVPATHWQVTVMRPAHDLGRAVLLVGQALRQLLMGLAHYGGSLIALGGPARWVQDTKGCARSSMKG